MTIEAPLNPITGIAGCCARAVSGHAADRAAEKGDGPAVASENSVQLTRDQQRIRT
jgi:hypothetical protein